MREITKPSLWTTLTPTGALIVLAEGSGNVNISLLCGELVSLYGFNLSMCLSGARRGPSKKQIGNTTEGSSGDRDPSIPLVKAAVRESSNESRSPTFAYMSARDFTYTLHAYLEVVEVSRDFPTRREGVHPFQEPIGSKSRDDSPAMQLGQYPGSRNAVRAIAGQKWVAEDWSG
jgi:hypothetical protein